MSVDLHLGDCLDVLPTIPDASVDCVLTDPPYPCIDRPYGKLTEAEWWSLIVDSVIPQVRRVLKPTGSAVFILQPNSRKVGSMRGWLWEFMSWACREWNMVQDAWWSNIAAMPAAGATSHGLMRPSLKACVWLGRDDCYRSQDSVLWTESQRNAQRRTNDRFEGRKNRPSGHSVSRAIFEAAVRRGGVTPFNVLPIPNTVSTGSAGGHGHGAGTPAALCNWWIRYTCPPGGTALDPFVGSGTVALEALKLGRNAIGIEKVPKYHATAERRVAELRAATPLFDEVSA